MKIILVLSLILLEVCSSQLKVFKFSPKKRDGFDENDIVKVSLANENTYSSGLLRFIIMHFLITIEAA